MMADRSRPRASVAEIRALLEERALDVAQHFAPPARGSYLLGDQWWTLNPGRPDKTVGSFVVNVSGARMGTWVDYATGAHGDLIDLIGLRMGLDNRGALEEARRWLGLDADTPAAREARRVAMVRAQERREAADRAVSEQRARRARAAQALWLSAEPHLRGTPVEAYLRDARGIDLARLGRQPRALRFDPRHAYKHMDPQTGEVFEGVWPAMLALVVGGDGAPVALHRTWLAQGPQGWGKAPVPVQKKVLGNFAGAAVNLWSGIGPRGGKGVPLRACPPGTRVYITEGIEDALSVVVLMPDARVLAAVSLSNLGAVSLPVNVAEVVLVADRDEGAQARELLARAVSAHASAGRRVRLWQPPEGCKDINDALRAQLRPQLGGV